MKKKQQKINAIKLSVLLAAFSAQPSYSEYQYGNSNNAALGGSSWGMSSSLFPVPTIQGLDINGVFYRYTAVKERADPYTVSIQNEAADGSGYIFRSTDDWSRSSGGTIQKFVPLPYSPVGDWGDGNIEQVGIGQVQEPTVLYSYRFDPCVNPQSNPNCPGYVDPSLYLPDLDIYDALSDENVLNAIKPTDLSLIDDDEESNKDDKEDEDDGRLEAALAASDNALTIGMGMSQGAMLQAMNTATNMNNYYVQQIQGGVYRETVVLQDKNIPDNRRALRSLGQQKLHTEMIEEQYR
jgi:hypothetical protein